MNQPQHEPKLKPGGILEQASKQAIGPLPRICATCGNLVAIGKSSLGCAPHDKLIIPDYPPYHGNGNCADWIEKGRDEA